MTATMVREQLREAGERVSLAVASYHSAVTVPMIERVIDLSLGTLDEWTQLEATRWRAMEIVFK